MMIKMKNRSWVTPVGVSVLCALALGGTPVWAQSAPFEAGFARTERVCIDPATGLGMTRIVWPRAEAEQDNLCVMVQPDPGRLSDPNSPPWDRVDLALDNGPDHSFTNPYNVGTEFVDRSGATSVFDLRQADPGPLPYNVGTEFVDRRGATSVFDLRQAEPNPHPWIIGAGRYIFTLFAAGASDCSRMAPTRALGSVIVEGVRCGAAPEHPPSAVSEYMACMAQCMSDCLESDPLCLENCDCICTHTHAWECVR